MCLKIKTRWNYRQGFNENNFAVIKKVVGIESQLDGARPSWIGSRYYILHLSISFLYLM